jgi:hypothetical protein
MIMSVLLVSGRMIPCKRLEGSGTREIQLLMGFRKAHYFLDWSLEAAGCVGGWGKSGLGKGDETVELLANGDP